MPTIELTADTKQPLTGTQDDRPMCERLSAQASVVSKDIQGMAEIAKEAAHEKLEEIQQHAAAAYEQGREKVRGTTRSLEHYIAEKPLTSVLIAGGIGLFLGRFWMRR